jgi:putative pyruvate formate lyase activating enzyme
MNEPSYIKHHEDGKLQEIANRLYSMYDKCRLCPRNCGVNRNDGEKGVCSAGIRAKVSSVHPHFGEERPIVGKYGSGTIFLTHCNLLCVYCQNWDISHSGEGEEISDEELAGEMIRLQKMKCHNINFVTPTHYLPNIIQALVFAVENGLNIPLVYNTGGYERVEILEMLDGVIDIYLPDYKYSDGKTASAFSNGAADYPEIVKAAIKEMHRQVGILKTDERHIARKGLIVRHLVLPGGIAGTEEFVEFVFDELDPATYVNIMPQYHPAYKAYHYPELSRNLSTTEYTKAILIARDRGLFTPLRGDL